MCMFVCVAFYFNQLFYQCLIIYITCRMYRGQLLLIAKSVVDCILLKIFASNLNFHPIPIGHFLHSSTLNANCLLLIYLCFLELRVIYVLHQISISKMWVLDVILFFVFLFFSSLFFPLQLNVNCLFLSIESLCFHHTSRRSHFESLI